MAKTLDNAVGPTGFPLRASGSNDWKSKIVDGVWSSPGGTRITFQFEDVSRTIDLRSTHFEFPGKDGVYVQRHGHGTRTYPLRCYFSGANCVDEAAAFVKALLEPGIGKLQHPLYGTFDCVPDGTITQRDDLVTGANQTIVEVAFLPTLRAIYPTALMEPGSEILGAVGLFEQAQIAQFTKLADMSNVMRQTGLVESVRNGLIEINTALRVSVMGVPDVRRAFEDAMSSLESSVNDLVALPEELAEQVLELIALPAEIAGYAVSALDNLLGGYSSLGANLIASDGANPGSKLTPSTIITSRTLQVSNEFHLADLQAMGSVGAMVRAVVGHEFTTRPEAINSAATVLDEFDTVMEWRDEGFADIAPIAINQRDIGESHQHLQTAVATTAGHLVRVSFSLVPERRLVLDRARNMVELVHELYKAQGESKLDDFIRNNDLTGDEILELPAGRTVVYYPEAA